MAGSKGEDCCGGSPSEGACEATATGRCPECSVVASKVGLRTVRSLVLPSLAQGVTEEQHYFCSEPGCEVVYFAPASGRSFSRAELSIRVGVKESEDPIPVCYCFGHTRGSISVEIAELGRTKVVEEIRAEIAAGRCRCEVANPAGKCCLGAVIDVVRELEDAVEDSPAEE